MRPPTETTPRSLLEFAERYDPQMPFDELARLAYELLDPANAEGLLLHVAEEGY